MTPVIDFGQHAKRSSIGQRIMDKILLQCSVGPTGTETGLGSARYASVFAHTSAAGAHRTYTSGERDCGSSVTPRVAATPKSTYSQPGSGMRQIASTQL